MALRSPKDLSLQKGRVRGTKHEVAIFWDKTADFGAYLKGMRASRGWTTRQAAEHFGVSQAYITKLENYDRKRAPRMEVIERVAEGYGLDLREVMHHAGYRYDIPPSLELKIGIDEAYRKLLGDPRFRPADYRPEQDQYLGPIVKQQFVDLAINVARIVRERDFDLEAWLRQPGDAE